MAKAKTKRKASKKTVEEPKTVIAEVVEDSDASPFDAHEAPAPGKVHRIEVDSGDDSDATPIESDLPVVASSGTRGLTHADPLSMYLAELRKYPLLTREQELQLAKRFYETKDPEAAQALVKANLRFVVKVAAEYSKFGARMIDLVQEGNVGLMHAVREYNPYKGARLITYAVWWIRGYIQEFLMRQYSMVRIGTTQNQRKLFYQLQKQQQALEAMGDHPDFKQLSTRLGVPEDEVRDMSQRLSGRDVSLDRPVGDDSSASLGDLQKDDMQEPMDERLARQEQLSMLQKSIDAIRPELNERELILLEERILNDEPLTLAEIGEKYGITREAVRQAETRLMKKIKDRMETGDQDKDDE